MKQVQGTTQGSTATVGVRACVATAPLAVCCTGCQGFCRACQRWSDCAHAAGDAQDHSDEVTAVTVHATGDYIVTASLDRTWAFYDIQAQICLTQVRPEPIQCSLSACAWHSRL